MQKDTLNTLKAAAMWKELQEEMYESHTFVGFVTWPKTGHNHGYTQGHPDICQVSFTEDQPVSSTRKITKLASIENNTESVSISPVSLTTGEATTYLLGRARYGHRLL